MESVSESLMSGWPHILVAYADSFDSMSEMRANEQSLLALCQVPSPPPTPQTHLRPRACPLLHLA